MADEYIRKHNAIAVAESYQVERTGFHLNDYEYGRNQVADSIASDLEDMQPADVVSVSAYKQVMLERDTAVEQLEQIGKDIREVMDDVVHLQRLLSADIAEIVRCKHCKHHSYDDKFCCYWCNHDEYMAREVNPDFYCAYGEE